MLKIIDITDETDDFFEVQARLFWLLGEKTRLHILYLLSEHPGQLCVDDLVEKIGTISQPTMSHHLHLLYQGGLLDLERDGVHKYYRIRTHTLDPLRHILTSISH